MSIYIFLVSGLAGRLAVALDVKGGYPGPGSRSPGVALDLGDGRAFPLPPLCLLRADLLTFTRDRPEWWVNALELTIAATCASRGSRGLLGVYTKVGLAAPPQSCLAVTTGGTAYVAPMASAMIDDDVSQKLDELLFVLLLPLPLPALVLL